MGTQIPLTDRGSAVPTFAIYGRRLCLRLYNTASVQYASHVYCGHACCGQAAGWLKIPLGIEIGLGAGHIVLDRDPVPPKKGAQQPRTFGLYLLWPNGWMDQDAYTWYDDRQQPKPHCVR